MSYTCPVLFRITNYKEYCFGALSGGRGLHCGLCASSRQSNPSGQDKELLQGTVVYCQTLHSLGKNTDM